MTRISDSQLQTTVDKINADLGTNFEIDNDTHCGGRTLLTRDPVTGSQNKLTARMKPQEFAAFLYGMFVALDEQRRT